MSKALTRQLPREVEVEDPVRKYRFGNTPMDAVLVQLGVMLENNEAWIPLVKDVIQIVEEEHAARRRARLRVLD